MEEWRKRLTDRINDLGMNNAEVSRLAKVGTTMVHDILRRNTTPSIENLRKIAAAVGLTLYNLFEDTTNGGVRLKNIHHVMGGEMWAERSKEPPRELQLSVLTQDLVSLEITSNDYRSSGYRRGDVIAGARSFGRHIDNYIGSDCIIETEEGQRLFKVLARGAVAGRYTLKSFDPANPDIADVKIKWCAPVQMILRNC